MRKPELRISPFSRQNSVTIVSEMSVAGRKSRMKKPELHTQEWRDFQPVLDPEGKIEKFKAELKRAEERVKEKRTKPRPVSRQQS